MDPKGYQLIEPLVLEPLYKAPGSVDFAVAILHWIVERVRADLHRELTHVQLEIIRVEYRGAYPAIGAHYLTDGPDVGLTVERAIEALLTQATAGELITFLGSDPRDWKRVTQSIMMAGE